MPTREAVKRKYAKYPLARIYDAFCRCHYRVRIGKVPNIEWSMRGGKQGSKISVDNAPGFFAFLKEIGPIPPDLIKPSVGRKDHSKGYITGNIQWEEYNFNSSNREYKRK